MSRRSSSFEEFKEKNPERYKKARELLERFKNHIISHVDEDLPLVVWDLILFSVISPGHKEKRMREGIVRNLLKELDIPYDPSKSIKEYLAKKRGKA